MNPPQNIEVYVFDLDGTLVASDPYENVLTDVARLSRIPFETLMHRYRDEWRGLTEAESYHRSLVASATDRDAISIRYSRFIRAKSDPSVLTGAMEILLFLRSNRKHLICWTRGDEEKQRMVLKRSGLEDLFDTILIPGVKNLETVQKMLLPAIQGKRFAIIGDSYEQDIVPTLDVAASVFWIYGSEANKIAGASNLDIDPRVIRMESIEPLYQYLSA